MNLKMLPLQSFLAKVDANPNAAYLHQPDSGVWTTYTLSETASRAAKLASALLANGCDKGDRISILSKNCADWVIADLGIMMAGMVSVPIYASAGESTISHVVSHSGAKIVLLGKLDESIAADAALKDVPVVTLGGRIEEGRPSLDSWLEQYEELKNIAQAEPEDLWTIVYTSGSTGVPKGVCLTYGNIRATARDQQAAYYESDDGKRALSYLPLAHVAERSCVEITSMYYDLEVFFNESLDTFMRDLQHARVTQFVSVPRLWAKFQAQVLAQIDYDTLESLLSSDSGAEVSRSIREKLGFGHCKSFGSGTAPIAPALLKWYTRIGIEIMEGWGMTETSGVAAGNTPFEPERLGSIGVPVNDVEMKLSEQGEILIRGEAIFTQYYKNATAMEEAFVDGWFRTGDRGDLQANGAWRIIGRVKEQFKTAKGKYVAPAPIESLLLADPYIEQACVSGSGQPQPFAIVVLVEGVSLEKEAMTSRFEQLLTEVNEQLESHEHLSGVYIVSEPWTIENERLTPTMKLKRDNIEASYADIMGSVKGVIWQ
ncbi:Long-chain-fatty-acid--CoA ligase FadD15 [Zhongshania aliphaticivorans]|uniref:Long-chain-fatty-acid--CoA ligase FadD15 n=1 Tax=Zhongshania aliphaticivorans TaxID=1470434 RepID=A0A5S9Q3F6_9GAMM|nr:AMP-binding protein [Zhongshania aliphaticivorans]CAA0093496.1 Long-chain-fatty-acid--CoA ligase FadD15 [Zhongshania aliphaticivorans]CAA0111437.1 Long-chain-fatty-acid--CoA ligase FadD15 [Zhongshania aliphaticivorans]